MENGVNKPMHMFDVATNVWGRRELFVNYYIIKSDKSNDWFLVDCGLKWSEHSIVEMAAYLFGAGTIPKAIILTHGHFDHTGCVQSLCEKWNVPVYAHRLEIPYLTGQSDYPPPDPVAGGGLMAYMSFLYPKSPINIWRHVKTLPADGEIPGLNGWKYIHTPGHTPGHVSLYREGDKVLIAGDAFVTTKAESLTAIVLQKQEVSGPPKYFTPDWEASKQSIDKLGELGMIVAATGHGKPMRGIQLQQQLTYLREHFNTKAIPPRGRYVSSPAVADGNGVLYVPPQQINGGETAIKAFCLSALVALAFVYKNYRRKQKIKKFEHLLDIEYNF